VDDAEKAEEMEEEEPVDVAIPPFFVVNNNESVNHLRR